MLQLPDIQEVNLNSIKDHFCVLAAAHPMSKIGLEMQFLSQGFQARGVYCLLLDLDANAFFKNLQRSAHARRFFLRKSREQSSTDTTFMALSRTESLFDAIAGGDWSLVTEIEELSPLDWMPRGEYEENYCYYRLIHTYVAGVLGRGDPTVVQEWRSRLERVVAEIPEGNFDSARLELCTQFLAGDEKGFWNSFQEFVDISGNAAAAAPLADGRISEFPWLAADRHLSVELLAWIALAQSRGYNPPEREYARCPSVAWLNGEVALASDLFLQVEARFGL